MKYNAGKGKVGEQGEIVIDGKLREELGIGPGWRAYQFVNDGRLTIYFRPPDDGRPLAGSLAEYVKGDEIPADADWGKIRDEVWSKAVREEMI